MESISDYIGFIISLIAMLFLFFRRNKTEDQSGHPGEAPKSQDNALKDFLRTMNIDVEEEQPKPRFKPRSKPKQKEVVQPSTTLEKWRQHDALEERKLKSQIEERRLQTSIKDFESKVEQQKLESHLEHRYVDPFGERNASKTQGYEVIQRERNESRVQLLLERLPSKKNMVIIQEIMGPPKGLK